MKDFTDITIVLDRSGSMNSIADATVEGFDEFVNKQKTQGDNAALTLVQFDDEYENVWNRLPIQDVPSIKNIYQPRGMTALLDAIGRTINEVGERLAKLPESERPNKVMFVIITDGHENASKIFARDKIFEMIRHQEDVYKWGFVFLGANQDAIAVGMTLGVKAGWSSTYNANSGCVSEVFNRMSDHVNTYRCCTSALEAVNFVGNNKLWTDEDREALVKE